MYEFELKNLINVPDNFRKGFLAFLQQEETVQLKESEFDDAFSYIKGHLQSEVGIWNESEVHNALLKWRISTRPSDSVAVQPPVIPPVLPVPPQPSPIFDQRKKKALDRVNGITEIGKAKDMLHRIANLGYDEILNIILNG